MERVLLTDEVGRTRFEARSGRPRRGMRGDPRKPAGSCWVWREGDPGRGAGQVTGGPGPPRPPAWPVHVNSNGPGPGSVSSGKGPAPDIAQAWGHPHPGRLAKPSGRRIPGDSCGSGQLRRPGEGGVRHRHPPTRRSPRARSPIRLPAPGPTCSCMAPNCVVLVHREPTDERRTKPRAGGGNGTLGPRPWHDLCTSVWTTIRAARPSRSISAVAGQTGPGWVFRSRWLGTASGARAMGGLGPIGPGGTGRGAEPRARRKGSALYYPGPGDDLLAVIPRAPGGSGVFYSSSAEMAAGIDGAFLGSLTFQPEGSSRWDFDPSNDNRSGRQLIRRPAGGNAESGNGPSPWPAHTSFVGQPPNEVNRRRGNHRHQMVSVPLF